MLFRSDIRIDEAARRAWRGTRELELTKTEFELLAALMRSPDRAFDRDTLLDRVWGDWYSDAHVVDVTVARLRRKLADAGVPEMIDTIRGVGYRLATRLRHLQVRAIIKEAGQQRELLSNVGQAHKVSLPKVEHPMQRLQAHILPQF